MTDDVRKLLGGYATGTLSESERSVLFTAALEDEELFAALADEQVLKNLLDDPSARAELLQAAERPKTRSVWRWLAPAGATVFAVLLAVIAIRMQSSQSAAFRTTTHEQITAANVKAHEDAQTAPEPGGTPKPLAAPAKRKARQSSSEAAANAPARVQPPVPTLATPVPTPSPAAPAQRDEQRAVPSVSQSVEVTAEAVSLQPDSSSRLSKEKGAMMAAASRKISAPAPIAFTLLKRSDTGEFVPVPNGALLTPADVIRVKVPLAGPGTLTLLQGTKVVAMESRASIEDVLLPARGGIALSAGTRLELILQPASGTMQGFKPGAAAPATALGERRTIINLKTQ